MILSLMLAQAAPTAEEIARVGQGKIEGGWGYIWAAYFVAFGGLALYAVFLWYRIHKHKNPLKENP